MAAAGRCESTPWLNNEEWISVYRALFSEEQNIQWALDRIAVWRCRSSSNILSEIDATEALFRAKTYSSGESSCRDTYNNVMLYSSAIVRFVKFISDTEDKKRVEAINRAARQLGIPDWVVNLRHEVAHSNMPSLDMLSVGVDFALRWLKMYYWDKENEKLSTVVPKLDTTSENLKESIKNGIDRFYMMQSQKGACTSDNLMVLIKSLYSKVKQHGALFSKILVDTGYLLPTYEQLKGILEKEELTFLNTRSTEIPKSLLEFWAPLLKLYDGKAGYYSLLQNLLASTQSNCTLLQRRLVAAWIVEIFNLSKKRNNYMKVPSLDWSKILTEALMCYNEYSPAYLTLMLEDSSVLIPEDRKQHMMALVAIRLGKTMDALPRTITRETNKVYTIDDLQKAKLYRDDSFEIDDNDYWKICTDPIDWKMYPIGLLPGQTAANIFDKAHTEKELKKSISEDTDITCNITEEVQVPKRSFQEISAIEDSEPLPIKRTLKHIMFF